MRKTERIDQILIRLGHVTEAEVDEAVQTQAAKGGRIGQNLIELGALTEEQLFDALVEQFRIPTITVDESVVVEELLDRMPRSALEESLIVPVGWNEQFGVLSLAVANPSDNKAIEEVRRAFGAKKVRVSLAPESVLADLVTRLASGEDGGEGRDSDLRLVALPELFEPEDSDEEAAETPAPTTEKEADRRALLVTHNPVEKNFLPAVFKSEGWNLVATSDPEVVAEALRAPLEAVFVAEGMAETFDRWIRGDVVPVPSCEILRFSGIAETLLDTPASYSALAASVRAAVSTIAELRCAAEGVAVSYSLMANDLEALAERVGLGRLPSDGLNIGVHLLMPVKAGTSIDPFRSFAETIELAHRIRYPWPVDTLLSHCLALYLGRIELAEVADPKEEVLLAAQVLALVWFRHNHFQAEAETAEEISIELRSALRKLAGRLGTLDVVEAYLELIAERGDAGEAVERTVLLVGGERIGRALGPALERVGGEVITAGDVSGAQSAVEETRPNAIVVDHGALAKEVERVCRVLRVDRNALLFVLTDGTDPALVLNLLDLGVDDVFGPPHDFDVISARIHRALRARAAVAVQEAVEGQFSAKFEAFSFLDLAQMLANGLKSVRVDLRRTSGDEGVLYVHKGRPIYAESGPLTGPKAVHHVVSWEDEGEFSVHEVDEFPEPNIDESIESLLMEGVRLLDESRA